MNRLFSRPTSSATWRTASKNGCDSMSPMVPPISVMTTSASVLFADAVDEVLDLIGNMRNHLHRGPQVFAAALFVQHVPIHLARRQVGIPVQILVDKPLVVAQVQVGFRAVLGHIDLAVLVRTHGAGVHVDVRIQLLGRHFQPARFQQPPQRRRRNALAQPGHHAAGHKNILRH